LCFEVFNQQAKNTRQPGFKRQQRGRVVEENGQKFLVFEGSPYCIDSYASGTGDHFGQCRPA